MKTIICSHGFGVRADSRGMFTDVSAAFADFDFKLFDYEEVAPNSDTVVRPLPERAKLLQQHVDSAEGEIILLCHSLGCIVAGLVDLAKVSKVILLTPPINITKQRFIDLLGSRQGSQYNPVGLSILPRTDGTTMYLPKEFFDSVDSVNPMELFQKVADIKSTVIIRATNDKIVGLTNVNEIKKAQHIDIDSDHNFTGDNRQKLIDQLRVLF